MIIGLTGTIASGKSSVAEILKEKGFEHHTYSDILRLVAKKRNIEQTRKNLQNLGNEFKKESNNLGILSKLIIENAKESNIIADGIRTVDEINELKGDPLTFEKFKEIDDHENKGLTPGQDINNCLKESDFKIINDSSREFLKEQLDKILEEINA